MSPTYSIELTDEEDKAMSYVCDDVDEWITNVVQNRARQAMDEVYNNEVERLMADPAVTSIPADKKEIVRAAKIKTGRQRNEEAVAERERLRAEREPREPKNADVPPQS